MTTLRRFTCDDMFEFANINLDSFTEIYNSAFYLTYLAEYPEYFSVACSPSGRQMGYVMGKVEGKEENWHGHVTAITIAPEYRTLGLARLLMHELEQVSEKIHNAYFVDLFVRASNFVALKMYNTLNYITYRRVLGYYSGEEDALDMRKALKRDKDKKSIIPLKHPVYPKDLD